MNESKNPFTEKEKIVNEKLMEAFNIFSSLDSQHPDEKREFCDAIHIAQNILAWRILRRDYPKQFPCKDSCGEFPAKKGD